MNTEADNSLHIIATGAATAVGSCAAATQIAVQCRITSIIEHPYCLDTQGEPYNVAMAQYIDSDSQGTERFNALLNESVLDCCADQTLPASTPFILCLPQERRTFRSEHVEEVAGQLLKDYPGLQLAPEGLLPHGHAAAYPALKLAQEYLKSHEFCILAGVDSYIDSVTLNWLDSHRNTFNAGNPYGFIPGEAAACLILCTPRTLQKRQLNSLGRFTALAHANEPVHHTQGVCTGQGLSEAISQVIKHHTPEQKIQHTICDLNGQPHRSDEFGFTLTRLSQHFSNPDNFTAPADCWGDVGAATGILQMVLATAQSVTTTEPNPLTLLWASSIKDLRGAALFQGMKEDEVGEDEVGLAI